MFGYRCGIQKDDKGNKILNISINLEYLSKFSNFKDELTVDVIETILDSYNAVGVLKDGIEKIFEEEYR